MKKKQGIAYFSLRHRHFCTMIGENKYRDLTTGEEFEELDDNAIRPVVPEDLLDSTILVESSEGNKSHYIRVSYCDVASTIKVNELITVDIDKNNKLVGIRLNYQWLSK